MRGQTGTGPAFDLSAVVSGLLWGLALLLAGAILQGVVSYRAPSAPATEALWTLFWQVAAALMAGFRAGQRAGGAGWLHGSLAGVGLTLMVTAITGIVASLPTMMGLLRALGVAAAAGALAGIGGVNLRSR